MSEVDDGVDGGVDRLEETVDADDVGQPLKEQFHFKINIILWNLILCPAIKVANSE